ncbi:MAG TPA: aldo/keto reductase [Mycobacteriales bacterium]|jgi:aryl-alcohol dehydrogenase-like predicted oxidoreductase|nr:aldo/keto reductase [Mycobacteriales bacterium]
MKHRHLGRSGLVVSRLALGTMTWGGDTGEDDAELQLRAFREAGGTLIDTADVYVKGESERVLGRLLAKEGGREEVLLATKAFGVTGPGPMGRGTSRGHLLAALDASLARLGTDWVDLWQVHAWDASTPLDETLDTLDTAVRSGRVRYAGLSNFTGWQTAKAAEHQRANGLTPIVSTQMEYSLLQRGIEREVVPACLDAGIGILPWSPLGRGVLTGKYRDGKVPSGSRAASGNFSSFVEPYLEDDRTHVVDAVLTAADGLGVTPVAVALAWVRDRPGVVAPIVGARTASQLAASLAAEAVTLPDEIRAALDDVSMPAASYPERLPFATRHEDVED